MRNLSAPHAKLGMTDSQGTLCNLYLIDNVEDIVIFLGLKVFNFENFYMFSFGRNVQPL